MSPAGATGSSSSSSGSSSGSSSSSLPADSVFSWVGVIMYLPSEDPQQRQAITDK
jgi:L-galactono-1,4-lactone dehydrogenase